MPTLLLLLAVLQAGPDSGIGGIVTSDTSPLHLHGVSVTLLTTGEVVQSDSLGAYQLLGVEPGWHWLRFSRLGYRTGEVRAYVSLGSVARVDITLSVSPIPLRQLNIRRLRALPAEGAPGTSTQDAAHIGTRLIDLSSTTRGPLVASSDLLDFLSSLPEVAGGPGLGGGVHVRGGRTDENAFLLDGAPILNAYHGFGQRSAVSPDVIGTLSLNSGAMPAEYGGRLSSVLDLRTRAPDLGRIRGRGAVGSLGGRFAVDGPLIPGRAGFLVSGRRSNSGLAPQLAGNDASESGFHDVLAKATLRLGGGTMQFLSFHTGDRLKFDAVVDPQTEGDGDFTPPSNLFEWSSQTNALSFVSRTPGGIQLKAVAWSASARASAEWRPEAKPLHLDNDLERRGVKASIMALVGSGWIQAGGSIEGYRLLYEVKSERGVGVRVNSRTAIMAGFVEAHQVFDDRWGVTVGLRGARRGGQTPGLEPRISVAYSPGSTILLGIGYARTRQDVFSLRNEESALDVALPVDLSGSLGGVGRPGTADLLLVSAAAPVGAGLRVSGQVFLKKARDVLFVAPSTIGPFATGGVERGRSSSAGLGVEVDGDWSQWQAKVMYRISSTRRRSARIDYQPNFLRTHWMAVALRRRLGDHVSVRVSGIMGSHAQTSAVTPGFEWAPNDPILGEGDLAGSPQRVSDSVNGLRVPPFFRVDTGVRAEWPSRLLGRAGVLGAYFNVLNVANRTNVYTFSQDPNGGALSPIPLSPLYLRAGLDWRF